MAKRVYIRGGYYQYLEKRETCPNDLHDWPLPYGYVEAHEVAGSRLAHRWTNKKCPQCNKYGWIPGDMKGTAAESVRVPYVPQAAT